MKLEQFLEENYKDILIQYQQFLRKDELPSVGSKVETLVSGYGGRGGIVRTVVKHVYKGQEGYENDYIVLSGGYLCEIKNWWKELKIVD